MKPEEFHERMIEVCEKSEDPFTKVQRAIAIMADTLCELGYGDGVGALFDELDLTPDIHS